MASWNGRRVAALLGGGLLAVALVGLAVLYGWSEYELRRDWGIALAPPPPLPGDAAALERGRRLAVYAGCYAGCHGATVEGRVWADHWAFARFTSPNLTVALRDYDDAELVRLLRHGVRRDGSTAFTMPVAQFRHFTDADLGALIAFLRSLPPVEGGPPHRRSLGPLGRLGLVRRDGVYPSVEDVDPAVPLAGERPPATPLERGRYLAMTGCPECHGPSLDGYPGDVAPPLVIVAAYSHAEFAALMRTGLAKGGREVSLMSEVARKRFAQLSDAEIAELYLYLRARAGLPPDPG